jgi:hypothetical protein
MYCLTLLDLGCFVLSIVFFFSTFREPDCYSKECPKAIKPWLLISFLNLYLFQLAVLVFFNLKNRAVVFWLWLFSSFVFMPAMFIFNVWGNLLMQDMDNTPECTYISYVQWFQMIYLISIYCISFVYAIFLITIKETMKRYHALMDPANNNRIGHIRIGDVPLFKDRSFRDICDSLMFSLFLIRDGRIGSRAEREYI